MKMTGFLQAETTAQNIRACDTATSRKCLRRDVNSVIATLQTVFRRPASVASV